MRNRRACGRASRSALRPASVQFVAARPQWRTARPWSRGRASLPVRSLAPKRRSSPAPCRHSWYSRRLTVLPRRRRARLRLLVLPTNRRGCCPGHLGGCSRAGRGPPARQPGSEYAWPRFARRGLPLRLVVQPSQREVPPDRLDLVRQLQVEHTCLGRASSSPRSRPCNRSSLPSARPALSAWSWWRHKSSGQACPASGKGRRSERVRFRQALPWRAGYGPGNDDLLEVAAAACCVYAGSAREQGRCLLRSSQLGVLG